MKVTIIPEDCMIIKDNIPMEFDYKYDENIHAIQWNNDRGHIEYKNGMLNEEITDFGIIKPYVDQYDAEVKRREEEVERERPMREIQEEIAKLKDYLNDTDYIWNAIKEGAHDEEYYKEIIEKRKEARARIRELENNVQA